MQFSSALLSAIIVSASQVSCAPAAGASTKWTPLCNDPSAESCAAIDPSKYLGSWFEQGRSLFIRSTFERDCNCVNANYALKPDGKNIRVGNTCVDANTNALKPIVGNAALLSNSQLKVSFGEGIARAIQDSIPGANYLIQNVWVDEKGDYKKALVTFGKGKGKRESIWVLARDAVLSQEEVDEALEYAKLAGYDPVGAEFQATPCTEEQRKVLNAAL